MSRQQTKAAHYILSLDEARCNGDWNAVPELIRKIRKHAPDRVCLTLAAECEHTVTQALSGRASVVPPSVASPQTAATSASQPITKYIPQLLTAIEEEEAHAEDAFQAQVCLGWLHWYLSEPALAAGRLPKNIVHDLAQLDGANRKSAEWTKVCALKASYIKGSSLAKTGAVAEGLECFESGLPLVTAASPKQRQWPEVRIWTENFLSGFCMLSSQAVKSRITSPLDPESLAAFRAWGAFCDSESSVGLGGRAPHAEVSRRQVWKEYYSALSHRLQLGLPFPPTGPQSQPTTKSQQRSEVKLVESKYESILLKEVQFPEADKFNHEVEAFLELVIQNWSIFCSGIWKDSDLGDGGAEAVSRDVLNILYRAATKTFHSTPIMRHLFSVHLALAEFDLAFKAFDTYMDIVKTARARIAQTGESEPGLDSDEIVLKTGSECIKALCRYGTLQGSGKAKDLGQFFEDWLTEFHPPSSKTDKSAENGRSTMNETIIAPKIIALTWRCIGISYAQWARVTFDASSRSDIQLKAIKSFRISLLPEYESTTNVETLFALGVILAERRDLSTAIEVVKLGLLPSSAKAQPETTEPHAGEFFRERSLVPLWHLMALLLSARQEFSMALRSCEGAFEQFKDPRILFGEESFGQHGNHLDEKSLPRHHGLVDEMDDFEKQNALEVKLTQLMLIEVQEGPEVAVNASGELLSLYSRLFGDPSKDAVPALATNLPPPAPPTSSSGTMRSLKGSIFGRSVRKSLPAVASKENTAAHQRSNTIQTVTSQAAPSIQVTTESGKDARHSQSNKGNRLEKQRGGEAIVQKKPSGSLRQRASSVGQHNLTINPPRAQEVDGEEFFTPPGDTEEQSQWLDPGQRASQVGLAISPDNTSIDESQEINSESAPPKPKQPEQGGLDTEGSRDSPLPNLSSYSSSISPVTRFPRSQQRQRRAAILVKVWLLIAGFYRRAEMYSDAKGAIEEAHNLVKSVDTETPSENSGNLSASHAGWGGGKSAKGLWADICAERGALAVAQSSPYTALEYFETALTQFADHPAAIIGLSKILADIYTKDLLPPPSIPPIAASAAMSHPAPNPSHQARSTSNATSLKTTTSNGPLGMSPSAPRKQIKAHPVDNAAKPPSSLKPPHEKEPSVAVLDKVAARDRAYGMLSTLTKLGTGWNDSEAWLALATSYELSGQLEKSRECLWWCVELEEARAVRDWSEVLGGVSRGGYVL